MSIEPNIVEVACVSHQLSIDVDGATRRTPDEVAHDAHRQGFLTSRNFAILRFGGDRMRTSSDGTVAQFDWTLDEFEAQSRMPETHARRITATRFEFASHPQGGQPS